MMLIGKHHKARGHLPVSHDRGKPENRDRGKPESHDMRTAT